MTSTLDDFVRKLEAHHAVVDACAHEWVEPRTDPDLGRVCTKCEVCELPWLERRNAQLRGLLRRAVCEFIEPLVISHVTKDTLWREEANKFVLEVAPVAFGPDEATFGVKMLPPSPDDPCWFCKEPCDALAGDPGLWPIRLVPPGGEPGVSRRMHTGCVMDRLQKLETLTGQLQQLPARMRTLVAGRSELEHQATADFVLDQLAMVLGTMLGDG